MKKLAGKITILFMALLLAVLPVASVAETTIATIQFEAGGLNWGDLDGTGLDNMNLDFGTRYLPTQAVVYETRNAPHSIKIEDARENVDGWNVKVSMGSFNAPGYTSFDGMIALSNGTPDSPHTTVLSPIEITSGLGNANVASSQAAAGRGIFNMEWTADTDVLLRLSLLEALKVEPAAYTATMTWTLSATPTF